MATKFRARAKENPMARRIASSCWTLPIQSCLVTMQSAGTWPASLVMCSGKAKWSAMADTSERSKAARYESKNVSTRGVGLLTLVSRQDVDARWLTLADRFERLRFQQIGQGPLPR